MRVESKYAYDNEEYKEFMKQNYPMDGYADFNLAGKDGK